MRRSPAAVLQAEARKKPKGPPLGGMPPATRGRTAIHSVGDAAPDSLWCRPRRRPRRRSTRDIANASGSSLVQLGLGAVKDKIFTTSQYLSDPAVRRAMGSAELRRDAKSELVSSTYGFSTGRHRRGGLQAGSADVEADPRARTRPRRSQTSMQGPTGRQEPNIFRRYGAGIEPTIPERRLARRGQSEDGEGGVAAASAGPEGAPRLERSGSHIARHRLSARKSSHRLHRKSLTSSAGISAARGHLGAKRSRHHRRRRRRFNPRTGQPILAGTNEAIDREDIDDGRRRLDRDMGDALDVSGRLNVAVDAPAGTEVKATGGGMFANSVSVDRRMGFEE